MRTRKRPLVGSTVSAAFAALVLASGCTITIAPGQVQLPTAPVAVSSSRPTASPSPNAVAPNRVKTSSKGSSATFEHFQVTVDKVRYARGQASVHAKVCVRSLPPDPQGDRTRISWDPWSVTAGTDAVRAGGNGSDPGDLFASDRTYRVGQCASGWIPFRIQGEVDTIRYSNGVGNKAIWDADRLDHRPVTRTEAASSGSGIGEGTFVVGRDVRPGSYVARAENGGLCYWARLRDDSGDFDAIIANNATSGHGAVTSSPATAPSRPAAAPSGAAAELVLGQAATS